MPENKPLSRRAFRSPTALSWEHTTPGLPLTLEHGGKNLGIASPAPLRRYLAFFHAASLLADLVLASPRKD